MTTEIQQSEFTKALLTMLEEVCEHVTGYILDPGTSLFETLEQISAEEASIPVGGRCASLAAQVAHVNLAMELTEHSLLTGKDKPVDWGEIWRTVRAVTPAEWDASRAQVKATYQRLRALAQAYQGWETEDAVLGAFALVSHIAYHLGEIRQATCTLKK